MSNRIKFYNSKDHTQKIDILINKKDAAKKLSEAKIAFAGYETLEEIQDYLNGKTGFVNTRLSAEAVGLESQYSTICKYINEIDLNIYLDDFSDLTPAYKEELKERYITYFADEENKEIDKIEKILKDLNALSLSSRKALQMNFHHYEWSLNLSRWNTFKQLKH
jgi:hypothetical protein